MTPGHVDLCVQLISFWVYFGIVILLIKPNGKGPR